MRILSIEDTKCRRSRKEQKSEKTIEVGNSSQENSPNHRNCQFENEICTSKPVECLVCSEYSEENVRYG